MNIKLLLILPLLYGFTVNSQTNNESSSGFESLKELGDFFNNSWQHFETKGEINPKYLMEKIDNCLLLVNIETESSIRLRFVDKETIKRVYDKRRSIDIKNPPKGFLCYGVISDVKIIKIGDNFLFFSDGHHMSTSLSLLEINKEQAVFEYSKNSFMGFASYSSIKTGRIYLNLD